MTELPVLTTIDDGIAVVTLNRPESMNAMNQALRRGIVEAFAGLRARDDVDAVILTGAGRAFCAGLDLKELGGEVPAGDIEPATNMEVREALEEFDRPIIGAINGVAITGGFELALMCDFLIGTPNTRFADTHARVGIVPGWGLSQRLSRWIGVGRAKELHFTGNYLHAETAERWGLLNRVVAPDELIPTAMQLARDIQSCDQAVIREVKRIADEGYETSLREGLRLELIASDEYSRRFNPQRNVAGRRAGIQQRGRAQQEGS
jgi:enoyl-CoA hydratase